MQKNVVLDYVDVCLYEEDTALLNNNGWLNDKLIGFMYQYYGNNMKDGSSKTVFLSPELVQFIKLCNDESDIKAQVNALNIEEMELIFIPINDSMSLFEIGGSHWSVLVYDRVGQQLVHLDSFGQANKRHAEIVANKIKFVFQESGEDITYNVDAPQQENSYDCGIYLLWYTETICENRKSQNCNIFDFADKHLNTSRKRKEIIKLIYELKNR